MSDSKQVVPVNAPEIDETPEDVKELQKALGELNSYHKAALSATYPGNHTEGGFKLIKHLFLEYQQVLKQFNEHPYVVSVREAQELAAKTRK